MSELLNGRQAAEFLGVHPGTLIHWRKINKGPKYKLVYQHWRKVALYSKEDLAVFRGPSKFERLIIAINDGDARTAELIAENLVGHAFSRHPGLAERSPLPLVEIDLNPDRGQPVLCSHSLGEAARYIQDVPFSEMNWA